MRLSRNCGRKHPGFSVSNPVFRCLEALPDSHDPQRAPAVPMGSLAGELFLDLVLLIENLVEAVGAPVRQPSALPAGGLRSWDSQEAAEPA